MSKYLISGSIMQGAIFEIDKEKQNIKIIDKNGYIHEFQHDLSKEKINPLQEVNYYISYESNIDSGINNSNKKINDLKIVEQEYFPYIEITDNNFIYTSNDLDFNHFMKINLFKSLKQSFLFLMSLYFMVFFLYIFFLYENYDFYDVKYYLDLLVYGLCDIMFNTMDDRYLTIENWKKAYLSLFGIFSIINIPIIFKIALFITRYKFKKAKNCLFQVDLKKALKNTKIKIKNNYTKIK